MCWGCSGLTVLFRHAHVGMETATSSNPFWQHHNWIEGFGDAMPKLKGLAQYAERFGDQYRRIEAVAKIGDKFRVLDLKEAATRASVSTATTIKALYESADAFDYLP